MSKTVRTLQRKLYCAAKQSLERKFGALYDKIYRMDILCEAWRRVRANGGGPGVDEETFEYIENQIGVVEFILDLHQKLKEEKYRPRAVKRVWIEKPGKEEKRPLGIPIIRDRVAQMATKLVIEPLFEANFLDCSHGFRPRRSVQTAIEQISRALTFKRQTEVIDADLRGCFDNIRHDLLLNLIRRRISDRRVLKLLKGWLCAGIMDGVTVTYPDGLGTPQGGVISPLLANIYLHSFDKMFEQSGIGGTMVRYADDFVILLRQGGHKVLKQIQRMLDRLGLQLHEEKTRVIKAHGGFDFLGVHLRMQPVQKKGSRLRYSCRIWPSNRSKDRLKDKVRLRIGRKYSMSIEEMIEEVNPTIRGWYQFHTKMCNQRRHLRGMNYFIWDRFRIFLKRKYAEQTRGGRRVSGNRLARLGLFQFV